MPDTNTTNDSPGVAAGKALAARIMAEAGEPVPVPEKALALLLKMACCAAIDPEAPFGQFEGAVLLSLADALPEGEEKAEVKAMVSDTLRHVVKARLVASLSAALKARAEG